MTRNGVVLNMTNLNSSQNGSGILVSACDGKSPLVCYVDVGGGQMWIDVFHAALQRGLTPLSLTDYMYATIGGTLSNAGMDGMAFRFGPQISNVLQLDVVTGKGDLVTCSKEKNSEAFYATLGGLGQFGVITRARILLGPAPTRAVLVKWLRLLYNNFTAFSIDQEHLISFSERNDITTADYVEGILLSNQPPVDLLFFPASDHQREVAYLLKGLNFVPTFVFEKDASYEEFVNRVYPLEQMLRSEGLWEVPHPWLNLWVPRSRMSDFDKVVFNDIVLKQNITGRSFLVYPTNQRNKWDDRMTPVTPDEDVFYVVDILRVATTFDVVEKLQAQNKQILQFCKDAGIKITEYLNR
ncbi:hypothetical protein JHK84_042836 [Glycine max]|nr:hypothetical protein JHK86_042618 [Glycine max]KAG5116723.1 hypothetical protein JHK84_042836 [Glycine max]